MALWFGKKIETVPGSSVPIPGPRDGARYGKANEACIASNLAILQTTYRDWETAGTVPVPSDEILGIGNGAIVRKAGEYARRESRYENGAGMTEQYALNLVRGLGATGLEQLVAISDQYTYAEILQSTKPSQATTADVLRVSRRQIDDVLDTFTIMQGRGLGVDYNGEDNVHIPTQPHQQFQVADYEVWPDQPVSAKVSGLANRVILGRPRLDETSLTEEVTARLPALERLQQAVEFRAEHAPQFWQESATVIQAIAAQVRG